MRMVLYEYLPYLFDVVAQGLAIAVVAYASQSAQLTHRDSPLAVIFFAITSILLFTLPRIGGDSRIPHVVVLLFGFTTILGYLFDVVRGECGYGSLIGKPPSFPSPPLLCRKAAVTWWLDLLLFIWVMVVLVYNLWQARRAEAHEETPPTEPERMPLLQ